MVYAKTSALVAILVSPLLGGMEKNPRESFIGKHRSMPPESVAKKDVKKNEKNQDKPSLHQALYEAFKNQDLYAAKNLIDKGASIDGRPDGKVTVLQMMMSLSHQDPKTYGVLMGEIMTYEQKIQELAELKEQKVGPMKMHYASVTAGQLDLLDAVETRADERVAELLTQGVNPNVPSNSMRNPLYEAVKRKNQDLARRLIDAGARTRFAPDGKMLIRFLLNKLRALDKDKYDEFVLEIYAYEDKVIAGLKGKRAFTKRPN
jgi:ankyrin repeat protein